MPIILSGGGSPEVVVPIDMYFASAIDLSKTVLYIPVAMEAHVFSYDECFAWFRSVYEGYGITNVEMCADLKQLHLDDRYGAVFIGGGNTFKLLNEIQQSDFQGQLRSYLDAGGVLYGGSAGAIVCGRTIEPAACEDENTVGLKDLSGLNLLVDYDVFCHYDLAKHDPFIEGLNRNLYVLYEESGLVFGGGKAMPLGKPFIEVTC